MEKRGVYVFFNHCIRDPLPPHNLLFKIGGGNIVDRFAYAEKAQGTYLPCGYEILTAKIIGEDWQKYESALHEKFANGRITPKLGSGNGTEWFRVSHQQIIEELNNIPGEWFVPPIDGTDKLKIQQKCIELGIKDSHDYSQQKEEDWLETPWGDNAYEFFNPNKPRMTKENFIKIVFEENNLLTTTEYEKFAKLNNLPTLREISDGYFGNRIGFLDLKEQAYPTQRR